MNKKIILCSFLILLFSTYVFLIVGFWGTKLFISWARPDSALKDTRISLPNSVQYDNAKDFFQEQSLLTFKPRSFVMYELTPYNGKWLNTATIANETIRVTIGNAKEKDIWFFGGSTMFGDSAPDKDTIPSLFSHQTGLGSINFGVGAYNSRHSLNRLLNLVANENIPKPKKVLFYDGVNDLVASCFTNLDYIPQMWREDLLHDNFQMSGNKKAPIEKEVFIRPVLFLIDYFKSKNLKSSLSWEKCIDSSGKINNVRLKEISVSMCNNWITASDIAHRHNIQFYAVLQPHLWSNPIHLRDHLLVEGHPAQDQLYIKFYEIFRSTCNKYLYVDGSLELDDKDYYFVDSVHLSPRGNYLIASFLSKIMQ
jgi:hypothetical protein